MEVSMVGIGVVGCGYWGPNLIRNFSKVLGCRLVAVADADPCKLETIERLYPTVRTSRTAQTLFDDARIDAVAIATPISTHYALAKQALQQGKHILIEKPMTATVAQSEELIELAERNHRVLMVDHTFIYTGAVRKIRHLIESGELGEIYYYDSVRVNLGLFQHDMNVLWDLAPHDFAIMSYLLGKDSVGVSAIGTSPVRWDGWSQESISYVSVELEHGPLAHFHLNWLSPVKVRRTLIGGSRKMVIYDHLDPDNQVKIFDKGIEIVNTRKRYEALVQYRTGDMTAPKIDQTEALEIACRHFVDCVNTEQRPITDGYAGLRVVQLLEASQRSLESQGEWVSLRCTVPQH
jgi:predicted dehydrogenase